MILIEYHKVTVATLKNKKVTQIQFSSANDYEINRISFDVKTALFLRNARIIVNRKREIKKRVEVYEEVISSFELSSKNENSFAINNLYEKEFTIEIDNQDNLPLEIASIKLFQNPVYLISDLKQHHFFLKKHRLLELVYMFMQKK